MDHGVDGVAAAPADAHDLQVRAEDPGLFQFQHAPPPRAGKFKKKFNIPNEKFCFWFLDESKEMIPKNVNHSMVS
jgi:hypothetical protein